MMAQENENLFKEAKSFFQVFEPKGNIITGVNVPGSVQLIGEVNELNHGTVISAAINKTAFIMAQKRKEGDRSLNFYSQRYDEKIRLSLNAPERKEEQGWAHYMAATLFMLEGVSKRVNGMNVYINNAIPDLFAANSMEALETGIATIASEFSDWEISGIEMAQVCADAEKKYIGRESHFVKYIPLILGEKGAVTYFDTATGEHENIKADFNSLTFMVMSSGLKKRSLDAKKKAIFREVAAALETIKKSNPEVDSLDKLTLEQFDDYRSKLTLEQRKRCAYFISENRRVKDARVCLKKGDIKGFIDVINESQRNIKNRLELTAEENEILVDTIQDTEGVHAVRLMNMGTDGTVLVVVDKDKKAQAESKIKKSFIARTGLELVSEVFTLETQLDTFSINVDEFKK
ncbi:MAG: hypothetical protein LLG37_01360 [Spirochaetia bacterium]|nr:hypothetical protein [Spirochaetia bacterium]